MADGREILRIIEQYDRASDQLESSAIAQLHAIMDAAFEAMIRDFRPAYADMQSRGSLLTPAQLQLLIIDQLGNALQLLSPADAARYEALFQGMITTADAAGGDLAGELIAAYDNTSLEAFTALPIEAVANQASEGSKRLYRYSEDFQTRANALIGQGLIQGFGARRIEQGLRAELGLSKGKAETLARTEVISALGQSSLARYQQNGVDYVQWNISPSEGLCGFCAARNQRVYRVDKLVFPLHPRDRCFLTPWKEEWQQLGLTDDAFAAEYRQRGLDQLKKNGLKPNYGISSFEKAAGLTEPPKAFWSPQELEKSSPTPTPARTNRNTSTQPRRERQSQPRLTPDQLRQRVNREEDQIRRNDFETMIAYGRTGRELIRKRGDGGSVEFSDREGQSLKGAIVTHNHPMPPDWWKKERTSGTSLSPADIAMAAKYEWGEIRAVTGGYRYSMRPPARGWNADWVSQTQPIYDQIYRQVETEVNAQTRQRAEQMKAQGRSRQEIEAEAYRLYNRDFLHEVNRRFAQETGAVYRRERWKETHE